MTLNLEQDVMIRYDALQMARATSYKSQTLENSRRGKHIDMSAGSSFFLSVSVLEQI